VTPMLVVVHDDARILWWDLNPLRGQSLTRVRRSLEPIGEERPMEY
jgi:hypothetical protein